ncbi:MAG: ATP-dependent DNA ligase [Candidatus Woesearchaeota archaeon]|jgi:DNA ligase-1
MDFIELAKVYEALESTSKRLKKTLIVSNLLKATPEQDLEYVMILVQGRVFLAQDEREMGVASKLVVKAIAVATGHTTSQIEEQWKKKGDLGLVAEHLCISKKQNTLFSEELTVSSVFKDLQKIAALEGIGSTDQKVKTISKLLSAAQPVEAKYLVRAVLQDLRVGIAEGTLRDAIAWAYLEGINPNYDSKTDTINPDDREKYNQFLQAIQSGLDKTNDFLIVAKEARKGMSALENIKLVVGNPVKVMLAQKVNSVSEAFEVVGRPAALEYKYDGFRMQVNKNKDEVIIYTRRLENVTAQFPEVKEFILKNVHAESCILDCEAAGFDSKTGKYTPFQQISQRIKRKYDIEKLAEILPVELNVFDILYLDGESVLSLPFIERRKILEKIINPIPKKIVLSEQLITDNDDDAKKFFDISVAKGNEGLMFKNLQGIYKPGSRVGHMIKLKSSMDDIDVVIVGAEWGEGKRSGWFTSFTVACQVDGEYLELGKVGTGLKEKREEGLSFDELTELLKPLIKKEIGREVIVKPKIVISLKFEEIQKSPSYSSGYALRFPRVSVLRDDRSPDDVISLEELEDVYYNQRKK